MATEPLHPHPGAYPQVGITDIDLAREARVIAAGVSPETENETVQIELESLRRQLTTERSASNALLGAVRELETKLNVERSKLNVEREESDALVTEVERLEAEMNDERKALRSQMVRAELLRVELEELDAVIAHLRSPRWRFWAR